MKKNYIIISKSFYSNCLLEAIKAKLKNWKAMKLYVIKPNKHTNSSFHIMWVNQKTDLGYDFSDCRVHTNWWKSILFKGNLRQFPKGFVQDFVLSKNIMSGLKYPTIENFVKQIKKVKNLTKEEEKQLQKTILNDLEQNFKD